MRRSSLMTARRSTLGGRHGRVAAAALALLPATGALAEDFYIDDGDVAGLIAAIEAANANPAEPATIHLATDGMYTLMSRNNHTEGFNGLPAIVSEITIEGNGAVIRRDEEALWFRILFVAVGGDLTLYRVTITRGYAVPEYGGGVLNAGTLTVSNSAISRNSALEGGGGVWNTGTLTVFKSIIELNFANDGEGGGVFNEGTMTASESDFLGNMASGFGLSGGGIYNVGEATLANCSIISNRADYAAGVSNSGTMTLTDCTISDNSATDWYDGKAGGVWNDGTLTATNTTVSGNSAPNSGGGIFNLFGVATLTNCTVSGNWSLGDGGGIRNGIYQYAGTLRLINCTLYGNAAPGRGGGVYNDSGTVELGNTIVAGSASASDIVGAYTDAGHNIVEDGAGITHPTSFAADPMLGPLSDNGGPTRTHALLPGSPAIDTGDCADGTVAEDQRGVPRPQGAACDIGAFELEIVDCYADCNGDTVVNTLDFICFLNFFTAGDPAADCNGDTVVNTLDFICFLNAFVSGCP